MLQNKLRKTHIAYTRSGVVFPRSTLTMSTNYPSAINSIECLMQGRRNSLADPAVNKYCKQSD